MSQVLGYARGSLMRLLLALSQGFQALSLDVSLLSIFL